MRQIRFRGKDKDGQWREGNLHQCWDGVAIISGWVDVSPSIRQHFTTQVDSATVEILVGGKYITLAEHESLLMLARVCLASEKKGGE